jgi:predicted Zn-dependent protease
LQNDIAAYQKAVADRDTRGQYIATLQATSDGMGAVSGACGILAAGQPETAPVTLPLAAGAASLGAAASTAALAIQGGGAIQDSLDQLNQNLSDGIILNDLDWQNLGLFGDQSLLINPGQIGSTLASASISGETLTLSGQNISAYLNNATVSVVAGAQVAITGSSNLVYGGALDNISLYGTNNTGTFGNNTTATVSGAGSTFTDGNNSTNTVNSDGVTLNTGTACTDGINCSGVTVNSSDSTIIAGTGDSFTTNGSGDAIAVGNNTNVTLNGSNDATSGGTGDTLVISGPGDTGDTAALTKGTVTLASSGDQATVSGSGNTTNVAGNDSLTINGSGVVNETGTSNTVNESGADTTLFVYGNNLTATATGANDTLVTLGSNAEAYTSGTSSLAETAGAGSTALAVGQSSEAYVMGTGSLAETAGTNSKAITVGQGDEAYTIGTYSLAETAGASSVAISVGQYDNAYVMGIGSLAEAAGANSNAIGVGQYDESYVIGTNSMAETAGADSTSMSVGLDDESYAQGASSLAKTTGADSSAITTGQYDEADATGAGSLSKGSGADDSVVASGVDDSLIACGGGDIVSATGSGDTINSNAGNSWNSTPNFTPPDPTTDPGDYGYGYGFAGTSTTIATAVGSNIGSIAQYDLSQGNLSGAAGAETALQEVQDAIASGTQSAVLEGAQWDSQVVTWSLAAQGGQFSSAMDNAEETAVQQAFATWGAATGIQFAEVTNASQSDIQVGLGDFNTASSGVVGYTAYQSSGGQLTSATVQVEDPTEDALVAGSDGLLTYSGTDATFSQALLHEIGHALGFADNADPDSVMSYYLGSGNQTLDASDLAGANVLYGTGSVSASATSMNQLIQSMAAFNADPGAASSVLSSLLAANTNILTTSLSAH